MSITVCTKPQCDPCTATKTRLDNKNVNYRTIDVTEDLDAYRFITDELGYRQTPVVYVDEDNHWSGFRIDALNKLAAA
ncbi:NrdH-redoxin [Rhodococcoides fascians]|uniref:glutaredoxin family protein n=1 Tax=Rhodococcoides fascians TaxID=1828 RepID=UPI000B9AEA79|nr:MULTISPECIES: glutaredoxin family protein [Rhodococcus]OZD68931.1 NrdH-redoxin [Rhodococcus sp. 06-1059B-a]OZE81389.1 NrdH-redoxin [Rhodococcus fascians]OZF10213.1 NrdH-redoxin [Rhodococcus fascians]OZF13303.1 NrdH-redoxin [Rhodococcus fascians]OZF60516.1 NrdH-redoxin [Rhodococcus fascians]